MRRQKFHKAKEKRFSITFVFIIRTIPSYNLLLLIMHKKQKQIATFMKFKGKTNSK